MTVVAGVIPPFTELLVNGRNLGLKILYETNNYVWV
jgi:hypothetical protein